MHEGGISIETYSAGACTDVASMVDNEHLRCTAMLPPIYNLGKKKKIKFLGFHAAVLVKTFPLMYQLPM